MKRVKLSLSPEARAEMVRDAESTHPNECCGFFYGSEDGEFRIVTEVRIAQNTKEGDQRRRFQISPLDYMKAEQYGDEKGLKLLGIYHSHPEHPAIPSEHDRSQAMPWFSYIILSVYSSKLKDIRSYQLNEDRQFEEEEILTPVITK